MRQHPISISNSAWRIRKMAWKLLTNTRILCSQMNGKRLGRAQSIVQLNGVKWYRYDRKGSDFVNWKSLSTWGWVVGVYGINNWYECRISFGDYTRVHGNCDLSESAALWHFMRACDCWTFSLGKRVFHSILPHKMAHGCTKFRDCVHEIVCRSIECYGCFFFLFTIILLFGFDVSSKRKCEMARRRRRRRKKNNEKVNRIRKPVWRNQSALCRTRMCATKHSSQFFFLLQRAQRAFNWWLFFKSIDVETAVSRSIRKFTGILCIF